LDAVPMRRIDSYFVARPIATAQDIPQSTVAASAQPVATITISNKSSKMQHMLWCYDLIDNILLKSSSSFSRRSLVQYVTVQKSLSCRIDGMGKVEAAEIASECLPGGASRTARCILNWTNVFLATGRLPVSNQGKHQKSVSLLSDEDVSIRIRDWLIETSKVHRTPEKLAKWVNHSLLLEMTGTCMSNVSVCSVRRWMNTLGYKYGIWKKGVFIDGHERADVVEYRTEFLQRMLSRFKFMQWWEGDDMETALGQECESENEIVWISHDESIFYANDDGGKGWGSEDHPDIHKKGNGRSIMVSDFICPCHGRLRFNGIPVSEIIEPGKNHDGYWQAPDILKQLEEKAIPAFEQMHPEARGLFMFDNSTNHGAYAADALVAVASKMNLNSGGKVPVMRTTKFVDASGTVVVQTMVDEHGIPKGLKQVLMERGLWVEKMPKDCKAKFAVGLNPECCALHRLGAQSDFKAQKSILYEAIDKTCHICDFLPKFHCELAPIENYWGYAKKYTRATCDYSIISLRMTVPLSLDAVPVPSIRKYFRRATHLMQAYAKGYSYKLAEYAHKKYKSHRRIPDHKIGPILDEIEGKK